MGNAAPGSPCCPLGGVPLATWWEQLPQTPPARRRRRRGHLQHLKVTPSCCLGLQSAAINPSVCSTPGTSSSQAPERVSQCSAASPAQPAALRRATHSPAGTWRGVSSHRSCFEAHRAQQHYSTKIWVLEGEGENIAHDYIHKRQNMLLAWLPQHPQIRPGTSAAFITRHFGSDRGT